MAVSDDSSPSSPSSSAADTKRRSAPSNGAYYLAKTVLRGSVVLQVVYGHIRSPSSNDIIFAKETSIELVIMDEDGIIQSICEQPVFGTIKDIAILPWNERFRARSPQIHGKDIIVVISDSGKLSFLAFCNEMHRFFPLTHIQLSSPGNELNELGRMLAVDTNGCFIAVSAYADKLALLSVSESAQSNIIDKRIFCPPESEGHIRTAKGITNIRGTIWSMCFISRDLCQPGQEQNAVLAVLLNRRKSYRNELLLIEWNTRENTLHVIYQYDDNGPLVYHIVEVPYSYGLAFLFRAGDAILMDLRDPYNPSFVYRVSLNFTPGSLEEKFDRDFRIPDIMDEEGMYSVAASALLELSDSMNIDDEARIEVGSNYICSWTWEPGNMNNPRMVFSADSGEIFMFDVFTDSDGLKVNLSDCLYKTLPAKALLWVDGGFLAVILDMGDGMVLKVEEEGLLYKSPIQNVAPILDISIVDCNDEKHNQIFACCGISPQGSLRIIRSGISVEKLLKTAPIYQGISGMWTVKMKTSDCYHSFLVLSFVEETRVLSVGISFSDVTDSVGFQPDVCTLACGLISDGLLVQIHQNAVRLCVPVKVAHPEGISLSSPISTSWSPNNMTISLGAIGHSLIVVATSSPCLLFILGVRSSSPYHHEVYQMQHVRLQHEISCISIPQNRLERKTYVSSRDSADMPILPTGVDIDNVFVIGTHKPSVEVWSFSCARGLEILAVGAISLTNTTGGSIGGCVPQDVRLVLVDRLYVLSGLRNGMLLRFEWPLSSELSSIESSIQSYTRSYLVNSIASPNITTQNYKASSNYAPNLSEKVRDGSSVHLQPIAVRRIGITPAFLVPLGDCLDSDMIVLSDRPWLLQTARHSLSYTSISFQSSTHVTPVCSSECPNGILFVSESCLHLVEMVPSKRLNVQKFHLGGTPRKVIYHSESRLLLIMRTELDDMQSSDVCCVDPLSGSLLSSFKFEPGETGKCMELVKAGNEHVIVIGTSLSSGPAVMPSGEAESTRGRLLVLCLEHLQNSGSSSAYCSRPGSSSERTSPFRENSGYPSEQLSTGSFCSSPDDNSCDMIKLEETGSWKLRLACSNIWSAMILAVCPYLERYFLVSAGNSFYVCSFQNDNPNRIKRLAVGRTRFMIMTLTAHFTRIAVGDCRDGIHFYSFQEDSKKLELLHSDPVQRLVADCTLMDVDTAVVSDRKGSVAVLSCSNHSEYNASPERNLSLDCSYYMGEIAMRIRKGPFSYNLPVDEGARDFTDSNVITDLSHNSVMASTLLGSIITFIRLTREEYELLEAVQTRLVIHPLTEPILGNDHREFRSRESPAGAPKMLDGDMLCQFLELTNAQQGAILSLPLASPSEVVLSPKQPAAPMTVNQVVRLLERVHYALN